MRKCRSARSSTDGPGETGIEAVGGGVVAGLRVGLALALPMKLIRVVMSMLPGNSGADALDRDAQSRVDPGPRSVGGDGHGASGFGQGETGTVAQRETQGAN